jgi:hypothetical protein
VGWGFLSTIWRIIDLVTSYSSDGQYRWSAGAGLYLALVASLGAAGTSGFVAIYRLVKKAT